MPHSDHRDAVTPGDVAMLRNWQRLAHFAEGWRRELQDLKCRRATLEADGCGEYGRSVVKEDAAALAHGLDDPNYVPPNKRLRRVK